jgi:tRNA-specific 2-thiouridylase
MGGAVDASARNVLVAMSGGVDSAVAAALLLRAGWEVTGVHFVPNPAAARGRAAADARRAAHRLGVELIVLDLQEAFAGILEYFLAEYAAGRTPNPCIRCNAEVKFARLLGEADARGIARVATGHHARRVSAAGRPAIARAPDRRKDQSYALFAVAREAIARCLLPVGDAGGKGAVRRIARELSLGLHQKPDSQEICFIPDDDYAGLLRRRCPRAMRPGKIVDARGRVLGEHDGYGQFTVGQRRGLGVAGGVPLYVTAIDAATATVTAGPRGEAEAASCTAAGANWHLEPPAEAFDALVQVRYNQPGAPARVRVTGRRTFEVRFRQPVHAVVPGQAAVVYDGDVLLGGGWIESAARPPRPREHPQR